MAKTLLTRLTNHIKEDFSEYKSSYHAYPHNNSCLLSLYFPFNNIKF